MTSPDGEGHVKVTVDDGSGTPKSYALDFDAASEMSARSSDPAGLGPQGQPAVGPDGRPVAAGEATEQVSARSDGKCVIQDGAMTITAERPLFAPDSITLTVDDGTGAAPTTYTVDFAEAAETGTDAATDPTADPTAAAAPGAVPGASQGAAQTDTVPPNAPATADPEVVETDSAAADPEPVQPAEATQTPATAPEHATTTQAWQGDPSGSVSGVLESDHAGGEAGLASADDAPADSGQQEPESSGMAGAGMPMMGGAGGAGPDGGRAGSGWSVHGDLFAAGDPVYSMHGVLGEEDLETR